MKAPDKIYIGASAGLVAIASNTRTFDSDIEYIRKDALLEWAKVMHDSNEKKRAIFIQGYSQAEKDLELTWNDIKLIVNIADEMLRTAPPRMQPNWLGSEEAYYTEVLNRYKEAKK